MINHRPKKSLGQHFLRNPSIINKILSCSNLKPSDVVLEIGPGRGILTRYLIREVAKLYLIEKDIQLCMVLRNDFKENVTLIEGDVLEIGLPPQDEIKIVSNLPYNIASQVIFLILDHRDRIPEAHLMVQNEVADRLISTTGKNYCPMGILLQNHYNIQKQFTIDRMSFTPPPKVTSAFVSFIKRNSPLLNISNETFFRKFLKAAFQHRRKTLVNSLEIAEFCPKDTAIPILEQLSFNPNCRTESLSRNDLATLSNLLEKN